jgi:hypothetical protein
MTRGKEYERLSSFIRQASKIVYDGIEKKSNER